MSLNDDGSVDLFVRALASYARIEGMKAANTSATMRNEYIPFTYDNFDHEASYLEMLWRR